ncbi:MAG: hypothetical protein F9K47_03035, partial [Burkholderiales bacterium]
MDIDGDDAGASKLADLLRFGVQLALEEKDFARALDRFHEALPQIHPELLAGIATGLPRKPFSMVLLRDIWNRTPQPDNEWRPRPVPKPERNAPCPCGSGEKFKACCAGVPESPFGPGLTVLSYVLERFPQESYAQLPWKRFDPQELAFVAEQWLDEGEDERAEALLVAMLDDLRRLDLRYEDAFDTLNNHYLEQGEQEKRDALVKRMQTVTDRGLQSAAWQRWASMCADRGEREDAWKAFATAQKADPKSPSLAHLEVTMLLAEGETERAQLRARFWARQFAGREDINPELIDLLEECAEDPARWLKGMARGDFDFEDEDDEDDDEYDVEYDEAVYDDALPRFIAALQPRAPECHYRLQVQGDAAGGLIPDAALAAAEGEWHENGPFAAEGAEDEADPWENLAWLDWLERHPLALQSFSIIDDLLEVLDLAPRESEKYEEPIEALYEALPRHAVALLRLVIAKNGAAGKKLEWGWLENRPALRLLAEAAQEATDLAARIDVLEWLVYTLNPNDNQGLRENLLYECLRAGETERAWKACEAYPDDGLTGMRYGRALCLFQLGRRDEAEDAWRQAAAAAPHVAKFLTQKKRPRPPETLGDFVAVGSIEEAWFYLMRTED